MERERIKIRRKPGDLYEDYSQGILDEHEYVLLKERYADTIEKAEVFEGDVLQVTWKHQDEYEKLLKLTS